MKTSTIHPRLMSVVFMLLVALVLIVVGSVSAETTSTVEYRIEFDATWSNTTHPYSNFPSNDHWSDLVGTTHNSNFRLWQAGQVASSGIEAVAEDGNPSTLEGIVNSAIAANNADQWLPGDSAGAGDGFATFNIMADSNFPYLSLAAMIAPSPDWFAGVDSLSLLDSSGVWREEIVLDVYPYDAGTEDGTEYDLNNSASSPIETIHSVRNSAPFSDAPVGTLTVTLLTPTAVGLANVGTSASGGLWATLIVLIGLLALTVRSIRTHNLSV